ncbi:N(2)-citryl-N(6)-acetyl-N(6)-hydroxylysine synthase [Bacillus licheniformis]|uniref:IucA/IucC family protein n=1 Tax=Bacillus haynesii TaxID=1925021 RepID=UPI0012B6DC8B|nr:IucA/IucC family protein [Bacillus haynesii]TWK31701.1 N(2)-citryl-N(6)-acetyl-N(6)-hydroxylysine synthase [Bacillus licheniformis]MCY7845441.1 IucA/IucC family siderophore biosynthesis protein [Bacillus haynesii]MCY7990352.1 IucA/IucC family siderophore biosynthesis protein [Bacillus haynesii]MCY8015345.1 IucA/IucC family siderophore biosynthesis protein [Bacillus haynesii]MCY8379864.1 IucA/IucC family siderophore biosynthesis protein [Bacillus haynesii]
MISFKEIAENATIQSFLNCYLRETGIKTRGIADGSQKTLIVPLKRQQIELIVPIKYWSKTGRHLFSFPLYYQTTQNGKPLPLDYVTLVSLASKELLLQQNRGNAEDEFMLRIILSCRNISRYVEERADDQNELSRADFTFIEAEQSLLLGHLMHPTPKSRQGMKPEEENIFSPELKGEFQLHYFKAHASLVLHDSSTGTKAPLVIQEELKNDSMIDNAWLDEQTADPDFALLPAHPLQARALLAEPYVQQLIDQGLLTYLGAKGRTFTATSSVRTVYSKHSRYMYKFSVPIKITNSLRVNKQKELDRGVEMARLLQTELGQRLKQEFPGFRVITDPAYISIRGENGESGFEVVIRENPFYEDDRSACLIAGLCQDHAYGKESRLSSVIRGLALKEGRTTEEVSIDWFDKYLSISLEPVLWLFETYGLAIEAHQQNAVIRLKNGYPETFYYRDNQGYYYSESKAGILSNLIEGLSKRSETICSDSVAVERLRYYFFFNHLFGLVNGFGCEGLIREETLLSMIRERLEKAEQIYGITELTDSLLRFSELPCKANLLTRFYDMDELTGSLETQSRYTSVNNPLLKEAAAVQ